MSKELLQNLKTRSGSYSGLDASIQADKQAQKSHATVPLIGQYSPSLEYVGCRLMFITDWFSTLLTLAGQVSLINIPDL
jgi:hypothetical protein